MPKKQSVIQKFVKLYSAASLDDQQAMREIAAALSPAPSKPARKAKPIKPVAASHVSTQPS